MLREPGRVSQQRQRGMMGQVTPVVSSKAWTRAWTVCVVAEGNCQAGGVCLGLIERRKRALCQCRVQGGCGARKIRPRGSEVRRGKTGQSNSEPARTRSRATWKLNFQGGFTNCRASLLFFSFLFSYYRVFLFSQQVQVAELLVRRTRWL